MTRYGTSLIKMMKRILCRACRNVQKVECRLKFAPESEKRIKRKRHKREKRENSAAAKDAILSVAGRRRAQKPQTQYARLSRNFN